MKKMFVFIGFLVLGSIITTAIDYHIGVDLSGSSFCVACGHKLTYIAWGGVVTLMFNWLFK